MASEWLLPPPLLPPLLQAPQPCTPLVPDHPKEASILLHLRPPQTGLAPSVLSTHSSQLLLSFQDQVKHSPLQEALSACMRGEGPSSGLLPLPVKSLLLGPLLSSEDLPSPPPATAFPRCRSRGTQTGRQERVHSPQLLSSHSYHHNCQQTRNHHSRRHVHGDRPEGLH